MKMTRNTKSPTSSYEVRLYGSWELLENFVTNDYEIAQNQFNAYLNDSLNTNNRVVLYEWLDGERIDLETEYVR